MKYWGYLAAKLAAAWVLMYIARAAIRFWLGGPTVYLGGDLTYTSAMLLFWLFSCGLIYLIVWDQRYRCRTCVRRLRMPVPAGSWPNMFLIGRPRIEYICRYGHGTLKVPEEQISGSGAPDWQPHEDIWRELESLEESHK